MKANIRTLPFFAVISVALFAGAAQAEPVAIVADAATTADSDVAPTPEWAPLDIANFGEELGARWIPVPNGESGAPRQGWLATADGFFTREAHVAYDYTDAQGLDAHNALARFNYPLSRRFWAGVELPFYQKRGTADGIGDVTLATRVMLAETRNVSINAGVAWRLPTGRTALGNNQFAAQPQVNLFTDVGHGFSLRGAVGYEFAGSSRGSDAFVLNGAIGQTISSHSKAPFGDFTWYAALNWRAPTNGSDFVSVTPGVRTHLGGNLFLLTGVELPVTNTSQSFKKRFIAQFVQGF
ncbi:MAG: transporter [Sphingomonas sp.]|jgi:hypothetical protein